MTNLETTLITFILTTVFWLITLDASCIVIERKKTKRADILSFDDGTIWHKVERVKND